MCLLVDTNMFTCRDERVYSWMQTCSLMEENAFSRGTNLVTCEDERICSLIQTRLAGQTCLPTEMNVSTNVFTRTCRDKLNQSITEMKEAT